MEIMYSMSMEEIAVNKKGSTLFESESQVQFYNLAQIIIEIILLFVQDAIDQFYSVTI